MRKIRVQVSDAIQLSVVLVSGTEEFRAFNRIKRKYLAEMNSRQTKASDDEPCNTEVANSAIVRGALLALAEVPQEELPEYLDAAWKPKGRPAIKVTPSQHVEQPEAEPKPDADLPERASLLH